MLLKPVCLAFIDTTLVMKIVECQEEEIFTSKTFFSAVWVKSVLMKKRNFKKKHWKLKDLDVQPNVGSSLGYLMKISVRV